LERFREGVQAGTWLQYLYPPDRVLESWRAALLGETHAREVSQGRLLVLEPLRAEVGQLEANTPCRAYSAEGEFLAILRYRGAGRWHPAKVFP
jgi:hypothetical protein